MSGFLIVNPRSGGGGVSTEELGAEARRLGIRLHELGEKEDAAEVARAANADVLGIAGGDGSLAEVAEVALERDVPFVCVPLGTRNHFARDLGLDRKDPLGALRSFAGAERRIDVGRADERLFLNNVSLGIYARLVRRREQNRRRREAFARMRAWAALLTQVRTERGARGRTLRRRRAAGRLEAAVDGEAEVLRTPIEFRIEPGALRVLVPDRDA